MLDLENLIEQDRFQKLLGLLDLSHASSKFEKALERSRDANQADDEAQAGLPLQRVRGRMLSQYLSRGTYRNWESAQSSSLLILAGKNYDGTQSQECWISPIAINTIDRIQKDQTRPFWAISLIDADQRREQQDTVHQVLVDILLQLVRRNVVCLRDPQQYDRLRQDLAEFEQLVHKTTPPDYGRGAKTDLAYQLAADVIQCFDETASVYIVLDRLDRCELGGKFNHRKALLEGLIKMVQRARCKLKILITVSAISWPAVDELKEDFRLGREEWFAVETVNQQEEISY